MLENRNAFPVPFEDPDEQQLEWLQDECGTEHREEYYASNEDIDLAGPRKQQMKAGYAGESAARDESTDSGGQQS